MKYFLHPQAREELEQSILFYKKQRAGLEKRFIEAAEDAINIEYVEIRCCIER